MKVDSSTPRTESVSSGPVHGELSALPGLAGDPVPSDWNNMSTQYPADALLPALISAQARRSPDAIALVFEGTPLTYRELERRSNQLAHYLIREGVVADTLVGISVYRSIEMVVGLLGILKAGGAYVPIDPEYPRERLTFMLKDAAPVVLLTQSSVLPTLPPHTARILCLDTDGTTFAQEDGELPAPMVTSANLAYMIYTSGSTGNPKGALNHHRGVCNRLLWMQERYQLTPEDAVLQKTPFSFDVSVWEFFWPLMIGARLVVARPGGHQNPAYLAQLIRDQAITVTHFVPSMLRTFLDEPTVPQCTTLRHVICSGEALTADLQEKFFGRLSCDLHNLYGPTEAAVDVTHWTCRRGVVSNVVPIGRPIANTQIHILDERLHPVPVGAEGELHIGGVQVGRGYHNRPELTAEKFIRDPFSTDPAARLYRTGDLARWLPDGNIEYLGRIDFQVKVRGFRIELGEIECVLAQHPAVQQAVVVAADEPGRDKRLVAYLSRRTELKATVTDLRRHLLEHLPEYMAPALFIWLDHIPLSPNGKVDRKALPKPSNQRPVLARAYMAPSTPTEERLVSLWRELLGLDLVGIDDSFFELGGTSLLAVRMTAAWLKQQSQELPLVKVFQYPTVAGLAAWLDRKEKNAKVFAEYERRTARIAATTRANGTQMPIAIIGMVGRFPGADDLETLWQNLCRGVESISIFSRDELGLGIDESLRHDPDYVPARGIVGGAEFFDASFFGISPLEASVIDPQQRVFLEMAYAALENAGYDPDRCPGPVGVYAGVGDNHYYPVNLLSNPKLLARAGRLAVEYGNEKDYIAMRVAYALGLTGPAVSANSGCSTSLLAVDNAVRGLASFECDLALAGGVDIHVPQKSGFLFEEGGTFCKDGHCRPFDADATGTMFCDGAGIVVLRRLDDAIAAGDTIHAVIRGSAKNNNGARAASFLAPSVEGQAEVIAMAQANAGIPIETIGYLEAHGTGTPVGDPIEFEALNQVFNAKTSKRRFCQLGSLKGNIGHPTIASGIAGLIKAAMVLQREQIPPTLHYRRPNPKIDFENSCFQVADRLVPFPRGTEPRRAAVSSFGFGGTNVHVILEEAPLTKPSTHSRPIHLVALSARTPAAAEAYSETLACHFAAMPENGIPDAAATLLRGRKQWSQRRFVVAESPAEAAALLRKPNPLKCAARTCTRRNPPVVFLFGGQGTQYIAMGADLYRGEPQFRAVFDECCEVLRPHLGCDLRAIIFPAKGTEEIAAEKLQNTCYTQPAIFTIEYALARWWMSMGVEPASMAGHSIGEFVAATLAGVFELTDVLRIVAARGRLMQSMPVGSMLSVRATVEQLEPVLPAMIQVAAINAPNQCVVSGPTHAIAEAQKVFESKGWASRLLRTSHAFHSAMMDPILVPLRAEFEGIKLHIPTRPFVSTVTGIPITDQQAVDPEYWVRHTRKTVRFSDAARWFLDHGHDLFVECGPRSTLCTLTRQHVAKGKAITAIPTLGDAPEETREWTSLLNAVGQLWLNGVTLDWEAFYAHEERRRVALPTYPFERQRHWVDAAPGSCATIPADAATTQIAPANSAAEPSPTAIKASAPALPRKARIAARLIELIAPISGRDGASIDPTATFLEQGFDSLSLVQVASGIRTELGVKVSFGHLMSHLPNIEILAAHLDQTLPADRFTGVLSAPTLSASSPTVTGAGATVPSPTDLRAIVEEQGRTIARLARLVEGTPAAQSQPENELSTTPSLAIAQPPPAGQGSDAVVELPSTMPQRGIFLSSRLSDHLSAAYNESVTLHLAGKIDVAALKRTCNALSARHDALRASFDSTGTAIHFHPERTTPFEVIDLSGLDEADQNKRLEEIIAGECEQPFSLPRGPLFRGKAVVFSPARAAIILTGHHVICDGWSIDVLVHNFCAFYSAEVGAVPASLPPAERYRDYVQLNADRAGSSEFKIARQYYEQRFAGGFPVLVLRTDRPRTGQRRFACQRQETVIAPSVVGALRSFAARQGCSFFVTVLAGYALLLSRISGQHRFVIALPTAEQPVLGQPQLVGHCVNMLPFEIDLAPGATVAAFLAGVQQQLSHAHDHAAYTITHILDRLRPSGHMVGVRPVSVGLTSLKKWRLSDLPQHGFAVDFDINAKRFESFEFYLMALERGDELVLRCNFDLGLFEPATITNWMQELASILKELPGQSTVALGSLARSDTRPGSPSPDVRYVLADEQPEVSLSDAAANRPPSGEASPEGKELVHRLVQLWQTTLNVPTAGPDDNFFDLGGHSMAAAQLFARIEQEIGRSVPLAVLFHSPTPIALANWIGANSTSNAWRPLVAIKPEGTRRPLFLIHGAEGNVLLYRSLASHLGPEQPVYGLQAAGLDGSPLGDTAFESVAKRYIEEIQTVQPHGPYRLGGYCLGGTIALEMACQLQATGETVELVAMLENYNLQAIGWPLPLPIRLANNVLNIFYHFLNVVEAPRGTRVAFIREKARVEISRAQISLRHFFGNVARVFGHSVAGWHHLMIRDAYDDALLRYNVKPFAGKISLFLPRRRLAGFREPLAGWNGLAAEGTELFTLSSNPRGSLVEPHVRELANVLHRCLP